MWDVIYSAVVFFPEMRLEIQSDIRLEKVLMNLLYWKTISLQMIGDQKKLNGGGEQNE